MWWQSPVLLGHSADIEEAVSARFMSNYNAMIYYDTNVLACPYSDICSCVFDYPSSLSRHIEAAHQGVGHRCMVLNCRRVYKFSGDLARHVRSAHGSPSHICDMCHKAFARRDVLVKHRRKCTVVCDSP